MKKQTFLFPCCFFMGLGSNILGLALVYLLADRFSFSPGQIGVFIALGNFFYFVGCNISHRVSSAFGPLKVIIFSSSVVFLVSIPLGYVKSSAVAYVSYWMLQIGGGLYWPPVMAWLTAGLNKKEMNSVIGVFNRSWMMGNVLGPLIAGPLYQWNTAVCFLAVNLSFFGAAFLLYLLRVFARDETGPAEVRRFAGETGELISDGPLAGVPASASQTVNRTENPVSKTMDKTFDLYRYRGWLSALCSAVFLGVMTNIVPLYIRDSLGYTERTAGIILFVRCVAGFAGFAVLARFTRWHFSKNWFLYLQGALIFSALFLLASGDRLPFYFVIAVVYGFLNSACYTNSIFYSGATGRNPKKNLAFHEIFLCAGSAIGSAGGGFFYQRFLFTGTCLILLLALGAGLGILFFLNRMEYATMSKKPK